MYDIQLVPNAIAQKKKRPVSSTVFARASSVGSSSQANKQKLLANNIQQSYPTNFDLFKQQQLDNSAKKLSENIYKAPHDDVFDNSHYFKRFRSSSAQTRKPQNSPIKQKPVDLKRKSVTIGISFIEQQQQKAQIDNLAEVQLGLNDLDLESDNDILSALEKLETQTKNFNIKSITLQQYNQPLKSNLIINQLKTVPRSSIINESRIKQQPQTTIRNQKQRVQSKNRDAVQYQQIIKDSCTKFTAIQSSNDVFIEFEKQVNSQSQQRAKQKFDQQEKAKYYKKVAGTDPLYMIEPDREFEPTINRQLKDYYVKKYDKIEQTEKKVDKALKDYLVKRQKGLLIK
ncbi:hypothetical protein SS50377_23306 [Spironucleus salmonicida]|nr:hypothetical protein SS50377_23306 [Spironucleus salmonicida]